MNHATFAKQLACTLIMLFILASCSGNKPRADKVTIERFDIDIRNFTALDSTDRARFRQRYADAIAFIAGTASAEVSDSFLTAYSQGRAATMFGDDIARRLTATDSLENALGTIRANLNRLLPDIRWPRITGVISTYNQSIIITDTTLLVGLNHYLGSDYEAYSNFEPYLRLTKTPRHLPYDLAEAIIATFCPYRPADDASLLNRILYEGAVAYAISKVVDNSDLAEIMGYNSESLKWVKNNERNIWNAMIDRDILYSVDPIVAERMVKIAPASPLIHPDAPGRLGRYIGLCIVDAYMKRNPETKLQYLLSPQFYNSPHSLIESGYNP